MLCTLMRFPQAPSPPPQVAVCCLLFWSGLALVCRVASGLAYKSDRVVSLVR